MAPSWRVFKKSLVLAGSSLLASGIEEAARTLKDAIFEVEMRKGEDFVALGSKGEEGHDESPLMEWESLLLGLVMLWFGRCGECDEEKERRVCILGETEANKERE